jgi:hypothetical protein
MPRIIAELFECGSSGSGLGNRDKRPWGIRRADNVTHLYPQKLALNSSTSGGRSVVVVDLRINCHGVCFLFISIVKEMHHTAICVTILEFVIILQFMSPYCNLCNHTEIYVIILQFVSSHCNLCHHTAIYVIILQFMSSNCYLGHHTAIYVIILQYMSSYGNLCHHTAICVMTKNFFKVLVILCN